MLVSPLRRVERFSELKPEEINDLFQSTRRIAKKIEEFYQAKSLSIAIQDGEFAGQTVKVISIENRRQRKEFYFSMFTFIFFHEYPVISEKMIRSIMRLKIFFVFVLLFERQSNFCLFS